jgi:hypothetical protein
VILVNRISAGKLCTVLCLHSVLVHCICTCIVACSAVLYDQRLYGALCQCALHSVCIINAPSSVFMYRPTELCGRGAMLVVGVVIMLAALGFIII